MLIPVYWQFGGLTREALEPYVGGMATVTIELPSHAAQTDLNLRRWSEVLSDRELAHIPGRIETDRHGHIIMSPPPAAGHGRLQAKIAHLLQSLLDHGETLTECPISTADGVKAADVAWASPESLRRLGAQACFANAPEICIEILSPDNTKAEMEEKMTLYFDSGAQEVWMCAGSGSMSFFGKNGARLAASAICPSFPRTIKSVLG